jgi:hypothetical protein
MIDAPFGRFGSIDEPLMPRLFRTWTQVRHCQRGQTPVTLSAVEDGLGEQQRVLLAHSMRNGHHQPPSPGGMIRLDLVR